jgi:hypothetical protein
MTSRPFSVVESGNRGPESNETQETQETVIALCSFCGEKMEDGGSCSQEAVVIGDSVYTPIRWGREKRYPFSVLSARCGDCAVRKGGVHHHGCDLEECPACRGQAISCGCPEMQ